MRRYFRRSGRCFRIEKEDVKNESGDSWPWATAYNMLIVYFASNLRTKPIEARTKDVWVQL